MQTLERYFFSENGGEEDDGKILNTDANTIFRLPSGVMYHFVPNRRIIGWPFEFEVRFL